MLNYFAVHFIECMLVRFPCPPCERVSGVIFLTYIILFLRIKYDWSLHMQQFQSFILSKRHKQQSYVGGAWEQGWFVTRKFIENTRRSFARGSGGVGMSFQARGKVSFPHQGRFGSDSGSVQAYN